MAAELQVAPPDDWFGWLDIIRTNFAAATSLHSVGSYQVFLPSAQQYLDPNYVADQVWPTATTDLKRLGIDSLEAALAAADSVKGAFYAQGIWDVELLGLPLAAGVISVDDDTFTVDAEFPMFGNVPVTVEFGGVTVTAGRTSAPLPVPGVDTTLSGADAAAALAGFGFPAVIEPDTAAAIRLQAYGPGYDPISSVAIERDGGIQIDATLDLDGLVDDAVFTLSVIGDDPATADVRGVATVASLGPFAGITITDATVTIERIAGVWSIGIVGDALTPLGSGTVDGQLDASLEGSMTIRFDDSTLDLDGFEVEVVIGVTSTRTVRGLSFASMLSGELDIPALGWTDVAVEGSFDDRGVDRLTLSASQATFGPVALTDGSFELVRSTRGWSLDVAATATIPGVLDPVTVNGSLAPDGTGSLTVTSAGAIRLGRAGAAAVTLSNSTATLQRTRISTRLSVAGDVTVLDLALRVFRSAIGLDDGDHRHPHRGDHRHRLRHGEPRRDLHGVGHRQHSAARLADGVGSDHLRRFRRHPRPGPGRRRHRHDFVDGRHRAHARRNLAHDRRIHPDQRHVHAPAHPACTRRRRVQHQTDDRRQDHAARCDLER